jgi:hypothetical protein
MYGHMGFASIVLRHPPRKILEGTLNIRWKWLLLASIHRPLDLFICFKEFGLYL